MDEETRERLLDALWGRRDADVRHQFRQALGDHLGSFESAISVAYEDWLAFEHVYAKDRDSATVVGFLFNVVARLTMSVNLLTIGQLALSGATFRQAQEALATAFVMADYDAPYRSRLWDGQFSVNKAVALFLKQSTGDPDLSAEPAQHLSKARAFYDRFSHPTLLAMADTIASKARGHVLGASFDPGKLLFYTKEIESRTSFAGTLPNAMDGVSLRMQRWPQFSQTG